MPDRKSGLVVVASMVPVKPASQTQPDGTAVPVESTGHGTASQRPEKKSGASVLAAMVPLKPASQAQPDVTAVPVESAGHCTAMQFCRL